VNRVDREGRYPALLALDIATVSSTQRRADAQRPGQSNAQLGNDIMATTNLTSATTPGFTQLELRTAYGVSQILLRLHDPI
jgi:hypothetical protein